MKHNPLEKCPRCHKAFGDMPPALSRLTRGDDGPRVYLCAFCGVQEAIDQYANNGIAIDWRK
jgi:hypothetical protein